MQDKSFIGPLTIAHLLTIWGILMPIVTACATYVWRQGKINRLDALLAEPFGFWEFLFTNPSRGTELEAVRYDIMAQRQHTKFILQQLEDLERAMGCGDPELGIVVRQMSDEDLSRARGIVICLSREHTRQSTHFGTGPWKEYFAQKRKGL